MKKEVLKGLHVKVGATESIEVMPKNGTDFSLEELKELIGGGYVQCVPLSGKWSGWIILLDEDGKLKELPYNALGSKVWAESYGMTDIICGDCVVCPSEMLK